MIDMAPLLKIMPLFAVALIVPGPDFMMITSMALSRGRRAGILAALGIATGNLVYTGLSMFGLGVVFEHMHWLIVVIRICGGVYLLYLGYQLWKSSLQTPVSEKLSASGPIKNKNPYRIGLLTNLTNPKALAFFTSIFALTLPPQATGATQAAIAALIVTMSVLWFGIVTFSLSAPAMRKVYMRCSRWIDRVAGTVMALFGLKLLFSGRN